MVDFSKSRSHRLLEKHDAPDTVKQLLVSLLGINASLPSEMQSSERKLLIDACKIENFTRPFEADGRKRSFRARLLPESHPDFRDDVGGSIVFTSKNSPGEEQSYRRGYDQGFGAAVRAMKANTSLRIIEKELEVIHKWRTEPLQVIGTLPGGKEEITIGLQFRRGNISLSLRFAVLQRDKSRCVLCGASASTGATLEIDHVIPISKGGDDSINNLQTLCYECNRGKSNR